MNNNMTMKILASLLISLIQLTAKSNESSVNPESERENRTIHILHMYTTDVTGRPYVPGREAVDFAVQMLNNRSDILNGYTIQIHDKDVEAVSVFNTYISFFF